MRIKWIQRKPAEGGSALIIALLTVLVIGVSLGSYLALVSTQNKSVMRSLAWNAAVPAMEAGVEEGLTYLRHYGTTNHYFAPNGWSLKADGWYQKQVSLGNDFGYIVRIQPVEPPNIVSTGLAPSPLGDRALGTTAATILTAAADRRNFVRRSVLVPCRRDALFAKGMVAKGIIDLLGNSVAADSFDSEDVRFSTGGRYDPLKKKDNGDVATNSGVEDSLNVGNAEVMGNVATGHGGSVDIGANGSVGDKIWVTTGKKGIQPGRSSSDMNVSFPDVVAPFTSGAIPVSDTVDGVTYDYVMGDGHYVLNNVGGEILVSGDAVLYVRDSIALSGEEYIKIAPGGSLEVYMAGARATISGGGVVNETGNALSFKYWGLPTNTQIDYGGNAAFVGAIYAPDAEFNLGGGGSTIYDFVGASITGTVKMNGHFKFHYDEALARNGPDRGYVPTSWNEISPVQALPTAAFAGMTELPPLPPVEGDPYAGDTPSGYN